MTVRKINGNPETSTGISTKVCCCGPAAKKRNHPSSLGGEVEQPNKAGAFETLCFLVVVDESEIHRVKNGKGAVIAKVQLQGDIDAI